MQDTIRLAGMAVGRTARRLQGGFGLTARLALMGRLRRARRLVIAPQDIRTADPVVAQDIYGGYFAFDGKALQLQGQSPFEVDPPSPGWSRNVMGFGWLRHLRAADTPLARANARAMVTDWLNFADRRFTAAAGQTVYEPRVVARRVLSWLSQSPVILEDASLPFYNRFIASLARQARQLQVAVSGGLEGDVRLLVAIALAQVSLCVEGLEGLQRKHARQLSAELKAQILADGGHVSRNPRLVAELLVDLLPLRQAYAARGTPVPPELADAIARMMPLLRLLRHGNGELGLFNGMGATAYDLLATVLAYDAGDGATLTSAPSTGYERRSAADALVIMDTGKSPPGTFANGAHAGCLSFEFSSGPQRLIVNCGAGDGEPSALREAVRATAAHSTLVLDATSSARFLGKQAESVTINRRLFGGPKQVTIGDVDGAQGRSIAASHDGYLTRFGFIHQRLLELSDDGTMLTGSDRLIASGRKAKSVGRLVELRFHLHPGVNPTLTEDEQGARLDLLGNESWYFSAGGALLALEDSVYLGATHGLQRSQQLVVRSNTATALQIDWVLQRYAVN